MGRDVQIPLGSVRSLFSYTNRLKDAFQIRKYYMYVKIHIIIVLQNRALSSLIVIQGTFNFYVKNKTANPEGKFGDKRHSNNYKHGVIDRANNMHILTI